MTFKCDECGSPDIWVYMWVDANSYLVKEECEGNECWCQQCDKITTYDTNPKEEENTK